MKLTRAQLLPSIRALVKDPAGSPLDMSAVTFALILWESGGHTDAVGDAGDSLGLLQIHQPTWAKQLGPFDTEKASDAEVARAVTYQVRYARPVLVDMLRAVTMGVAEVARRIKKGEKLRFNPIRDLPVWASLAWQYGSPSLTKFTKASKDLSSDGWASYRKGAKLGLQPDHEKRQAFIRETYFKSLRNPAKLLERIQEISRATGVDFFTNAAKALHLHEREIQRWAQTSGAKLLKVRGGGSSLLPMLFGAGLIYFGATEDDGKGGRKLSGETRSEVGSILGGLAMLAMGRMQG